MLVEELLAKVLLNFENCVLVNNNLCGKLFSSFDSTMIFNKIFKVTSVPFLISDFSLLSYELDNVTFKVLY